jgi:hypothetical protein
MSMINDALRRASGGAAPVTPPPLPGQPETVDNSFSATPPPLPGSEVISPTEGAPPLLQPPPKKSSLPILLLALFLFCLAGAAGIYLWERNHKAHLPKQNQKGQTLANAATTKPIVVQAKTRTEAAEAAKTSPAAAPTQSASNNSAHAGTPAPTNPPVAVAPPLPMNVTFPNLRLQSIYYRPPNPSVMINGRTLYVNDQVQGVTVAGIERASVTLVLGGRTNILTLR